MEHPAWSAANCKMETKQNPNHSGVDTSLKYEKQKQNKTKKHNQTKILSVVDELEHF